MCSGKWSRVEVGWEMESCRGGIRHGSHEEVGC